MNEDKFLEFVEAKAREIGKIFVLDCGEGRPAEIEGMDVEDLSGWLLDEPEDVHVLRSADKYDENFFFVIWSQDEDGNLAIDFKQFN